MDASCYCDYEPARFYHHEDRRARKPHRCDECAGVIPHGEDYEHVRAKWENIATWRTCARCLALRNYVTAAVPCVCWYHGNMREDVLGTAEHYSHEAPGLLFGALRREIWIRRGSA